MRFLNFTLIKLCLSFIGGIYLGFFIDLELWVWITCVGGLLILLTIFKWVIQQKMLYLWSSVLLFALIGGLTTHIHLPENQPHHLYHLNLKSQNHFTIEADVSEILRPNAYNHKYILENLKIDHKQYQGKLLLNVNQDSVDETISLGNKILMSSELLPFHQARNPQTFDYRSFMHNRDVFAVVYEDKYKTIPKTGFSLTTYTGKLRSRVVSVLIDSGFDDKHVELIQALILGQKQAINRETYNEFAEVGVVHILAVSGLHVGIVFLIFQVLFTPILRLKFGRQFRVSLTIIALWAFAALAGFSPSVMRAVTMFSFLALGQMFRRKTNSINMLCLSAMVLLVFRPQLLFEVGFQLSYAAVFAIVMLYPVLSRLYQPKYKIPKLFWDTAYVSLAAQIGVLPFQLFYFHQFPGLFLLGNLVIIPFLGILISGGLACIVLGLLGGLISPIIDGYSYLLDLLINYVDWLSQFKNFVFQSIFFTKPMFISILILIICFILMMREFKRSNILIFLFSLSGFVIICFSEIHKTDMYSEIIIFHQNRQSVIGIKQGRQLKIFSDQTDDLTTSYVIKNYQLINRIDSINYYPLKNSFKFAGNTLTVIDSSGVYLNKAISDIVLLSQSPDIHLEKLIKIKKPKRIIADGNNFKSYVSRWQETAREHNIRFHSTYQGGAVSFNLP